MNVTYCCADNCILHGFPWLQVDVVDVRCILATYPDDLKLGREKINDCIFTIPNAHTEVRYCNAVKRAAQVMQSYAAFCLSN